MKVNEDFGNSKDRVIARKIASVRGLTHLDRIAQFDVGNGELLYRNPAAGAVFQDVLERAAGQGKAVKVEGVTGLYGKGNAPKRFIKAAEELYGKDIADLFRKAVDQSQGDIIIAPSEDFGSKGTGQEERGHRFIHRSGLKKTFTDDPDNLEGTLNESYSNLKNRDIKDEKFAKSLRDDAEKELQATRPETRANRRKFWGELEKAGLATAENMDEIAKIGRKGEALAKYGKKRLRASSKGRIPGNKGTLVDNVGSGDPLGGEGIRESGRPVRTESDNQFEKLRQTELSKAGGSGAEQTGLARLSPPEARYIEKKSRGNEALQKALTDEVLFARSKTLEKKMESSR